MDTAVVLSWTCLCVGCVPLLGLVLFLYLSDERTAFHVYPVDATRRHFG